MQLSKQVGKPPREIADRLVEGLKDVQEVESAEAAGPGFVNITLTQQARSVLLLDSWKACEPQKVRKGEAPVIVEYSHPNIAKPLGVHHILSTVLGQAIANLYRHLGYSVISWNYIGDWGTQFGKLAVAMEKWGDKTKKTKEYSVDELLALYVRFHDEAAKDPALEEQGRAAFRKLEEGDTATRKFWEDVVAISLRDLDALYERLHISFDTNKGESAYENEMQPIIDEGKKKGIFVEGKDGALIVEFPEEQNLPVFLIVKSDGGTLYSTRDLAMARDRKDSHSPQSVLHVVDTAQETYFRQLFATMERLEWGMEHEEHVVYGRMSFPDKSMSTRKGNILRLEDALDEAVKRADKLIEEKESEVTGSDRQTLADMMGVGAFVYAILSQHRKHNIVFTWEKALSFEGNSGPYLQYTHARARSVLRKAGEAVSGERLAVSNVEKQELLLMRRIMLFPSVLEEARAEAMPHKLTNYLYSLSQDYNAFYNALPILKAEEAARELRLTLTALTADILKSGAQILTLRVPDRM